MAIHGFNLDQTREFEKKVKELRDKLRCDAEYKKNVLEDESEYLKIRNFFSYHVEFLKYTSEVVIDTLYRVRKLESLIPFTERKDLLYPPASIHHKDRMNNIFSRVLYVSLHEYTAMAETRLNESDIGVYFQLTKFCPNRNFIVFRLGQFNEIYKEMPRDSGRAKEMMNEWFGSPNHDGTIRGYAALECAIADIMYDQEDDYHILSSIMADAIFFVNSSIEGIIYPSVQNRYGINLAIKKSLADELEIRNSFVNRLEEVYSNGFFKYQTLKECNYINQNCALEFSDVNNEGYFRSVYR
jgi:hypothetical protein